jgi:hypothetical protein
MAVISTNTSDTFEQWRVKTNQVSAFIGDSGTLSGRYTATDVVAALNEIKTTSTFDNKITIADQVVDGTTELAGDAAILKITAGSADVLTLNQTGNVTVAADLSTVGAISAGTTLGVTGNTTIGGTTTSQGQVIANAGIDCNGSQDISGTLDVGGATALASTLGVTGNTTLATTQTGALTVTGALNVGSNTITTTGAMNAGSFSTTGTLSVNGNVTLGNSTAADLVSFGSRVNTAINPSVNNGFTLGTSSLKWSTVHATTFSGTATTANYADLAELYLSDFAYEAGTVVRVGGEFEITATDGNHNHSVLGVISAYPAYLMNNQLENGIPVALKGRVPVKVGGTVKKGDRLVGALEGYGVVDNESPHGFAVALEDFKATKKNPTGIVEAVIL